MKIKLSVLTPCYNGEKYLDRYFKSLLNQTFKNFEIVLVDDGSTDKTSIIVKKYINKFNEKSINLKYIYQKNEGQASAINNGLKYINGEYLIWPDCDDYYEPDAFKLLVNELDNNLNISSVRGKAIYRKEKDLSIVSYGMPYEPLKQDLFLDYILFTKNVYCFCGVIMIRVKDFKESNKGMNIYISRAGQNWQLILPITYKRKCKFIDENIYNCVIRANSHSHKKNTISEEIRKNCEFKKILLNTINNVVDNKKEKSEFSKLIKKKYNKIIIKLKIKRMLKI